jgi:DNA polymerase I
MTQTYRNIALIDGSNMLYRAWNMAKPRARSSDGLEVGAVWLFSQMVAKIHRRMMSGRIPPSHIAIFFDPAREATWRRAIFPEYKSGRPPMDELLVPQVPLMMEMCEVIGLGVGLCDTHEADDLIAAYAEDAAACGGRATIISSDKDLMQLVRPRILQYHPMMDKFFTESEVEKKFDIPPALLGDFLAMAGDKSDGIPGAPGVGPKTAVALLKQFGSLDAILEGTAEIESKAWRKRIEENADLVRMSRRLVALDSANAPRVIAPDQMVALSEMELAGRLDEWRFGTIN